MRFAYIHLHEFFVPEHKPIIAFRRVFTAENLVKCDQTATGEEVLSDTDFSVNVIGTIIEEKTPNSGAGESIVVLNCVYRHHGFNRIHGIWVWVCKIIA